MPPSCVTGHSISQRVRFESSRRPAKSAFYRRGKLVVSELFTMKIHPVSVTWTMGFNNEVHYYSSLQLACTFNTNAKHTKTHKKLNCLSLLRFSLLLPNCEGSHSALIYKFKDVNSNTYAYTHEIPTSHEQVRGGGVSFAIAARVRPVQYPSHPNMHRECLCIHPSLVAWSDEVTHPCQTSVVLWVTISPPRHETPGSIFISTN